MLALLLGLALFPLVAMLHTGVDILISGVSAGTIALVSTAGGARHERFLRRLACAAGAVLAGFIPNEVWRMLGLWLGGGVDEGSELLIWVRAVATAILAGVIAQILVAAAGRAGERAGMAAIRRSGRRICGLPRGAAVDFCRRGRRRIADACWQMVARVMNIRGLTARPLMVRENEIREGEHAVDAPLARDAGLIFIGRIRTPWTSRLATPRQGRHDGPVCRLEIFEPWVPALKGVDFYSNLEVIYWLHQSRRDLVLQSPKNNKSTRGTFSLRSPVRPNPIGTSIVKLVSVEGSTVFVRGLDCLDETPLLDLKPDRCEFTPLAPPQAGDFETE